MKRRAFFVASILLISLIGCVNVKENGIIERTMDKKIVLRADSFSNYIFHLYSIAMINERDSAYRKKYINTISNTETNYLHNNRKLLAFGDGETGELASLFLFFPLYIRPESYIEIKEYYSLLSNAIISGDASFFLRNYDNYLIELEKHWQPMGNIGENIIKLKKYEKEATAIASIIINNYDTFFKNVWPQEKINIDIQIEYLQPLIDKRDFIRKWEELTGLVFEYPVYEITLCSSLETVSNAVSAGYDRNNFYYNEDEESFIIFISHETGTHILISIFENMDYFIKNYGFSNFYKAYEVLVAYYNKKIAGEMQIQTYDSDTFFKIFTEIEENYLGIRALELIKIGLEKYTDQ
jgi:hypothetical protein